MRLLAAVGLAGMCLAASQAYAADLFESAPPPLVAPGEQEELGSNWYIRGDVGYGQTVQDTVSFDSGLFPTIGNAPIGDANSPVSPVRGNAQTTTGAIFDIGAGYRINDWFRAEADWQFSKGPGWSGQYLAYCPEVATIAPSGSTTPVGYQYDYTTCDGNVKVSQFNTTALAMGYIDLGHYWSFTPYIGVGGGLNANIISGSLNYNQSDTGVTYTGATVTGTAPGVYVTQVGGVYVPVTSTSPVQRGVTQAVGPANWSRKLASTKYSFAAAAAAGLGFQISQSATLDLGYKLETLDVTGGVKSVLQSVNLGVRYNIN